MATNEQTKCKVQRFSNFDGTFSKQTWREDTTLIVEEKRLYVSSVVLSLVSPVFTTMFEDEMNKGKNFKLEERKYEHVVEFLQCIYPNILKPVTYENVFAVLPLAVVYEVHSLKEKCEAALETFIDASTSALEICRVLQVISEYNLDQSIRDVYVRYAVKQGIAKILEADKEYPLSLDIKIQVQSGVIESLQTDLNDSKMQLTSLRSYANILRQIDFKRLWFGEDIVPDLEDIRIGYLTFNIHKPGSTTDVRSPGISVHHFLWKIYVNSKDGQKFGIYLEGSPEKKEIYNWTCKVYGKIVVRNKKVTSDFSKKIDHNFTASEFDWGYKNFIDIETLRDTDNGYLNDRGEVTVDIKFLVGKPDCSIVKITE